MPVVRDKKRKCPDIDAIHDYIMKTQVSNANQTLIKDLVKEHIKQNVMINKKQLGQTSPDQTLPDPPQILNASKTPDTTDKETLPDSPLFLNDILTPDTKVKQTTSSSSSFQESFSLLKAALYELKLSIMDEICEVRNSISDIKAKKDVHSAAESR